MNNKNGSFFHIVHLEVLFEKSTILSAWYCGSVARVNLLLNNPYSQMKMEHYGTFTIIVFS